ncbi:putative Ig domain-containing protein [Actinoplanes sp. CA-030573]|uniref:type IV pilus modification PilV family protein n=1 Tax=Actinoplanes sp. CA-030573 TaxID=3239898 RepID=UPI003D8BC11B
MRCCRPCRPAGDDGFGLAEMLVALAILSVTMLASAPFFVRSLSNVNKQRTRQAAIQLAGTAMEQVRGLKGSSLLSGRSVLATQAQFDAAPAVVRPYLDQMQVAGSPTIKDSASTAGAEAPISTAAQHVTVEGTTYTQNIYVGQCEIYLTGTSECIYPKGSAAPADSTDVLQFFRVVVLETWPDNTCADGSCAYVATTLVSRASEPTFDFNRPAPQVMDNNQTWYVGDAVSYQMKARGGQLPNTWTIAALPAGLSMSPSGVITGTPTTPTASGGLATTATVTDHANRNNTGSVIFTVVRPPTPAVPASAASRVGDAYNLSLSATYGVPPYSAWTATGLPTGLQIDAATGAVTGTTTVAGVYTVTVRVTDANQRTGAATYTHTVTPGLTLTGVSDQTIDLGSKLDFTAAASGGDGKYTFSAAGMPPGTSIGNKNGKVSSKSTASGRFLATITVADGSGLSTSLPMVVIVTTSNSLVFTAPSLTAPDQTTARGSAASLTLRTNGTLLGLSPVLTVSGLPPGLTLNALTGVISGTPTTAGRYTVTATATTAAPASSSILTFVWTIT